jgi:hypothetical protein
MMDDGLDRKKRNVVVMSFVHEGEEWIINLFYSGFLLGCWN